jgi:hypothetical protein
MKPVKDKEFEGCGSFDANIKAYLEKEFLELNDALISLKTKNGSNKKDIIRAWLIACLAKTIKESINISIPITDIEN